MMQSRVLSFAALLFLASLELVPAFAKEDWEEQEPTVEPTDVIVDVPSQPGGPDVDLNISNIGIGGDLIITINGGQYQVPDYVIEDVALQMQEDALSISEGVTPSLAGFHLVDVKSPKAEGSAKMIKDNTTDIVVPAEMGMDFTFTAVPESACVTAVQFLLFDNKGVFIDWDTFREPPYLEKVNKGNKDGRNAFKAFGAAPTSPSPGGSNGQTGAFARGAREALKGPGTFILAAIPFSGESEGKDIEITFSVPTTQKTAFLENN
ncbi:unnamed protein product [Vitrella brassicaformis CCMP3155]|uniref:Uncharacterized protein n=1 Tax=Vitrella brassicaformis (strain CCMP3155) TaxID=1169540 RepID=A0A0G4EIM4_VITBC|nr:unnamed protein product [Vitrella brassicaformis CCMP3155]|eukprot:CEL96853.1 unnamed protein product [Vitrella brassicaformis CCMP3155]